MNMLDFLYNNTIVTYILYIIAIITIIILLFKLKKKFYGNFSETNLFRRLKIIYKEYDYPYIKEIILPMNKENYIYFDAIVLADKYIYIIEMKNHSSKLYADNLNEWYLINNKDKKITITNPYYELDVKKHVLNRYLNIDANRIIPIVVYNIDTHIISKDNPINLISIKQLKSFITKFESSSNYPKFKGEFIEKVGNELLSYNVKNPKIRYKVINKLLNQRTKK
ncbi:nuclease-related domain-containing protein [Mycoplasma sp. P36-A1]|uniref:nuclease-related domain-containing protein n=1 Tax=Mycoplasma sp. P36-A1 TaxID=3252900 RepID=UPI003C2DB7F4